MNYAEATGLFSHELRCNGSHLMSENHFYYCICSSAYQGASWTFYSPHSGSENTQWIQATWLIGRSILMETSISSAWCEPLLDWIANIFFVKPTVLILQLFRRPESFPGKQSGTRNIVTHGTSLLIIQFSFFRQSRYLAFFVSLASFRSSLSFNTISICFSFCCTW